MRNFIALSGIILLVIVAVCGCSEWASYKTSAKDKIFFAGCFQGHVQRGNVYASDWLDTKYYVKICLKQHKYGLISGDGEAVSHTQKNDLIIVVTGWAEKETEAKLELHVAPLKHTYSAVAVINPSDNSELDLTITGRTETITTPGSFVMKGKLSKMGGTLKGGIW